MKTEPEGDDAGAYHALRPEAIDHPAEHRAEYGGLHRLQHRRTRERGLAPAQFLGQDGEVDAKRLMQQGRLQELDAATRGDHAPAVENFHGGGRWLSLAQSGGASPPADCASASVAVALRRRRDLDRLLYGGEPAATFIAALMRSGFMPSL